MPKYDDGEYDETIERESERRPPGRVRWGVAAHLLLAFCGVTLMTLLVAMVGISGLRDARRTLQTSRDSFDRVSSLLDDSNRSLDSTGATIDNAVVTLDATVATMEETRDRVTALNAVDLPAVIAIGAIREALTAVAVGERTLLMRQLYDPEIRQEQRKSIAAAFVRADAALMRFVDISTRLSPDKRHAWLEFLDSWRDWVEVHYRLMDQFDIIDGMLRQRGRGGRARASRWWRKRSGTSPPGAPRPPEKRRPWSRIR